MYGVDPSGNPSTLFVQTDGNVIEVITRQGGVNITLNNDANEGWSTLGFSVGQIGTDVGTTEGVTETTASIGTTVFPNLYTVQQSSTSITANQLPTQTSNPYFLLSSDLMTCDNFYSSDDGGMINISAIVSKNYASGSFIYSFDNSFTRVFEEDVVIKSILTRITLPNGQVPDGIDENNTVIYELTSPPPQQI